MQADSLHIIEYILGMVFANTELLLLLLPMLVLFELPLGLTILVGIFRWSAQNVHSVPQAFPDISVVVTCYSEGRDIAITLDTLVEQLYPGNIEILAVVDGASQNLLTYQTALISMRLHSGQPRRTIRVIPKWQRGGRVSTLNAGLAEAGGELVINVDGDTSFDNDMVLRMLEQFGDPNLVACGGALRVRNWRTNLLTRMQAMEYMLSMQAGKTGLANIGVINNISGAFGAFRAPLLKQLGGWDTHTAEDLDLTIRLKQYKQRYPALRLGFTPHAVGHTDVPDTLKGLVAQRLRWDGDLLFIFLRKHKKGLTPTLLGWKNFLFTLAYGVLQNVLLPLLAVVFILYLLLAYPINFVGALMSVLYILYLLVCTLFFAVYLLLISERSRDDFMMIKWLPLYPLYQFFMRLITAFAMINETVRRGHEESSMAPWWVLKRGNRF
ncbi:glycosyltransferase family 2 protein [Aestuariirhabdus litorea]|uniref:Glycosyltransferase n=1 Tax=Aestuariirhabdus litorea TaxID=2528527 RepID=A0A3P3VTV5_9GAMM|nr:glycosyltransferase [Aestuariirhabdus litorea]RRJ84193.1 glycosyltransferase [Aestuariirhabdus litorea]RWW97414.1 glycosyltransferase [Endozoicomonadaceae bacterium GTF-13]